MQWATLLLLLPLCAANGQGSVVLKSGSARDLGCKDWRGRSGTWEFCSNSNRKKEVCLTNEAAHCAVPDLPPRLAGGLWECDEHYELAGTRYSWPGGALLVQPEKCKPV
jgi:hypothetical protein